MADLFVSIHADAHPKPEIDGFTIYVARQSSAQSRALVDKTVETMKRCVGAFRGVRKQDFRVLVRTRMPAILIELGYLTNRADATKLSTGSYRQQLADAIADGIVSYINSRP